MPYLQLNQPAQLAQTLWNAAYDALHQAHAHVHTVANRYGIPDIAGVAAQNLTTIGAAVARGWRMRPDTRQVAANRRRCQRYTTDD